VTKIWVFDVEGNGLNPDKLYCLAACNPKKKDPRVTPSYDIMRKLLTEADILIGHNIARFDIPVLEKLLGIKIKAKLVDTLALSWYLYPNRLKHSLDSHGIDLGMKKPEVDDWDTQPQEVYEHRCVEDVKINTALWNNMYKYLFDIYGSDKEIWKLLDYLAFKMHCARLQEASQWKIDVEFVRKELFALEEESANKKLQLAAAMPAVPTVITKSKPKRFINADGEFSKLGTEWIKLLSEHSLPPSYEGTVDVVKGYEPGNPASSSQIKSWLDSLGWVPRTFKYVKEKDKKELRAIPQINLELGKGICDSIKELYDQEPSLELLDGLSILQHRIGILRGFLSNQKDGYIKAQVNGFTNTLRFKHTTIVNLPKIDRRYALPVRSALICEKGQELCGSDMSSLEDRIKQHFLYMYDPDYVNSMNQEGFDPHLIIAGMAGMLTQQQIEAYKSGDKTLKRIRDTAKNGNYACQYGAGPPRLVLTCGISLAMATALHKAYWDLNWAIKKVASEQVHKIVNDQMWLYNPISQLWYSLRFEKDVFSTLVQGTASYVFDMWVKKILDKREQLTGQFHDEFIISIREGHREGCEKLIRDSIKELNEELKLNRELDCDVQFGQNYAQIH
jgi:DNA polymerase family A